MAGLVPEQATSITGKLAVSAAELARGLGISLRHVRRLDASGKLPYGIRFGRAKRWSVAEIISWLAADCPDRRSWETAKAQR